MGFRGILIVLAILGATILAVAVLILKPALLAYIIGVFTPSAAVFVLEGRAKRFAWIGSAAMTLAAAGPVVLAGLLDSTRFIMGDLWAWIVPIGAGMAGTLVAIVVPMIGEVLTTREQKEQFAILEERQAALIADWGETIKEPLNPTS
jgi:MFS family permease